MAFDLSTWQKSAAEKLHGIGGWLDRRRMQEAPYLLYGTLCGLTLWPLVEAARSGQLLPAMMTLGAVAGGMGGELLAEQVQRWKDGADEAQVAQWTAETAPQNADLHTALDAILAKMDAVTHAEAALGDADRQWFTDTLKDEMARLSQGTSYSVKMVNSTGAVAQGEQAKAAGPGSVVAETILGPVTIQNIDKQEVHAALPLSPVERARVHYLKRLHQQCSVLPLGALGGDEETGQDVSLEQVYIALDTQTLVPLSDVEKEKIKRERGWRPREDRPLSALEVATDNPRLVLLGDAGSGKSTFVRQLTAWLAAACVGEREPLPGWDTGLLPIFTTLRDLSPRLSSLALDRISEKERQRQLVEAVWAQWQADLKALGAADLSSGLEEALSDGNVVLVLDGLDEVPAGLRDRVRLAVHAVLSSYPHLQRLILTCRIRSYVGAAVFHTCEAHTLAPFDEHKIAQFVRAWYVAQTELGRLSPNKADERAQDLTQAALSADLVTLAANPMLLTTMAVIHRREVGLPRERVRLYALAVQVLISRWQKPKGIFISPELEMKLNSDLEMRALLNRLGYEAHCRQRGGALDSEADLARKDVLEILEEPEYLAGAGLADEFLDYVDQRAGLLVGRGGDEDGHKPQTYAFPHRTFQEYLAGCHMAEGRAREIAGNYLDRCKEGDHWYLAAQLGAEELLYNKTQPGDVLDLAYALCPSKAPSDETAWRAVLWSGQLAVLLGTDRIHRDARQAAWRLGLPRTATVVPG